MPDAIVDAVYYDAVVNQHCICSSVHTDDDGPVVVLKYVETGATVSVPLGPFKKSESINVRQTRDAVPA